MIVYQVQFTATEQPVVAGAATTANRLQGIELVMRQRAGCEM